MELQKRDYSAYGDSVYMVKQKLENFYKQIIEELSDVHFSLIWDILEKDKIIIDKAKLIKKFKENLEKRLLDEFNQFWNLSNLNEALSIMEIMKKKTKDDKKQWRPSGKSVQEQLRPYIVRAVNGKILYYEKQIDYQQAHLNIIKAIINDKRKIMSNIINSRHKVSSTIDEKLKELNEIKSQIKEYKLTLHKYQSLL